MPIICVDAGVIDLCLIISTSITNPNRSHFILMPIICVDGNSCIRRVTIGGLQNTVAGTCGTSGTQFNSAATSAVLSYIYGVEKAPGGAFLFTDFYAHAILHVSDAGVMSVFAGTIGQEGNSGKLNFRIRLIITLTFFSR